MPKPDGKNKVVWDVAEGVRAPVVRNGVVSFDRRGLFARMGGMLAAVATFMVARRSNADPAYRAAADAYDGTTHTDIAHGDSTANHTDLPGPPHADGQPHYDRAHIDENTFSDSTPTPHGDG